MVSDIGEDETHSPTFSVSGSESFHAEDAVKGAAEEYAPEPSQSPTRRTAGAPTSRRSLEQPFRTSDGGIIFSSFHKSQDLTGLLTGEVNEPERSTTRQSFQNSSIQSLELLNGAELCVESLSQGERRVESNAPDLQADAGSLTDIQLENKVLKEYLGEIQKEAELQRTEFETEKENLLLEAQRQAELQRLHFETEMDALQKEVERERQELKYEKEALLKDAELRGQQCETDKESMLGEALEEQAKLEECIVRLQDENRRLHEALKSAEGAMNIERSPKKQKAANSDLSELQLELATLRSESEREISSLKHQLWEMESLNNTLERAAAVSEKARLDACAAADTHIKNTGTLEKENRNLQLKIEHLISLQDAGITTSQDGCESPVVFSSAGTKNKKVIWDVHGLQAENKALLDNMQKQADMRDELQQEVTQLRLQVKTVKTLETELAKLRAENYNLACKHRAVLSRLEALLAEDAQLRVRLEEQSSIIQRLESACQEIEDMSRRAEGLRQQVRKDSSEETSALEESAESKLKVATSGNKDSALQQMALKFEGYVKEVQQERLLDCSPVVSRVLSELDKRNISLPHPTGESPNVHALGARLEALTEERTKLVEENQSFKCELEDHVESMQILEDEVIKLRKQLERQAKHESSLEEIGSTAAVQQEWTKKKLATTMSELEVTEAELQKLRRREGEAQGELKVAEAELQRLRRREGEAQSNLQAAEAELQKLRRREGELQGELEVVEAELQRLRRREADAQGELEEREHKHKAQVEKLKGEAEHSAEEQARGMKQLHHELQISVDELQGAREEAERCRAVEASCHVEQKRLQDELAQHR
ncbi:hypothetical protein CYMTET_36093, partial [Cymbomonas tetramitiformis]